MTNEVLILFEKISAAAMDRGLDLQLEQKEYYHDAKGFGPSIGGGHTEDTGVVLRVFQPDRDEDPEKDGDDNEEAIE